jgi:SNARE protein 1
MSASTETKAKELALLRLISACEARVQSQSDEPTTSSTASPDRKFRQHVDAMREFMRALSTHGTTDDDAEERLKGYARRVDALELVYAKKKEKLKEDARVAEKSRNTASTTTATTTPSSPTRRTARTSEGPTGVSGVNVRDVDAGNNTSTTTKRRTAVKALTLEDEAELRRQRAIQEGLTDEMSELATGLKRNAVALELGLQSSNRALENVESRLERNVAGVKSSVKRQTDVYRANKRGSCWTWIIFAIVGILFAWTYMVIKMTTDRTKRGGR